MNDGHRTSTIARPRPRTRAAAVPDRSGRADRVRVDRVDPERLEREAERRGRNSRLGDLTTPIERDKQLVPQKRGRLVVALFSVIIALAIGAALFVLPVKSWFQQRDDLTTRTSELDTLNAANDQLQLEVDRLQTEAGIKEAAREEIDYVEAGERRLTVLPIGPSSAILPTGWPYNLITQIVTLRQQQAAQAISDAAAAAAPVVTVAAGG